MSRAELLKKLDIIESNEDLRRLSTSELVAHFASRRSGRVVMTRLMRSVIWQAHRQIQRGEEAPIYGNLRTFWYRFLKPLLGRLPSHQTPKQDPYDAMLAVFVEMVLDHKLFRYKDFDFTDENWENRRIGTSRPHVLVFAEKRGWVRFLRDLHTLWGVSTLALGGAPSALTSEYTADHIREVLPPRQPLILFGLVDFDPAGAVIAAAFQRQLAAQGLDVSTLHLPIHPQYYSPEELELFSYPLSKRQPTLTRRWLDRTGGILGQPRGLEIESMPRPRLLSLLEQHLAVIPELRPKTT